MSRLLYWTVAILLLAGTVHIGYVLFVPHIEMRSKLNELRGLADTGALTVLSREDSIRLMGPDGRWLVHALCIYDLADGPMTIVAAVPNSYWSMTMYSAGGDTFYSLNDRQAGVDRVALMLRQPTEPTPTDDELEQEVVPDEDTLTVRVPAATGLVVMRALAGEAAEYQRISQILAQSSCRSQVG
jgi:uncharacterized membrane protein